MRTMIRGGVWKNTEDEILKVAVMKYGHMQWDRISSLLSRKSARQCKQRWYEFLDPSIKHTEWSREEEEKLLHLAKLMPNQWRTIAPLVGRTAMQCLETYERLLDAAEGKTADDPDDPRKLLPGQIDPSPETRPARPDPVDMDEDEKEMLSEARARLANTRGKKAKRKARERQLEEARRLAQLQKRRELKAAGVQSRLVTRKRKGMDYVGEIVFERTAAPGFYDTSQEAAHAERHAGFREFDNRAMEKRRDDEEEKMRKKDAAKHKRLAKANAALQAQRDAAINDPLQQRRRSALALPAPQVSEDELHSIVKSGALAAEEAAAAAAGGSGATRALLGEYQPVGLPTPMRTPRVAGPDLVAQEAANLVALSQGSTPLLGGDNAALSGGTGFAGVTPMRTPLAGVGAGPAPGATPMRDAIGLNDESELLAAFEGGEDRRAEKRRVREERRALEESLRALPEPEFEYEIAAPELGDDGDDGEAQAAEQEEDAEERVARLSREAEANLARARARWSTAVQRELPRPANAGAAFREGAVDEEMTLLLQRDAAEHPPAPAAAADDGGKKSKKRKAAKTAGPARAPAPHVPFVSDELMAAARQLVADETAAEQQQDPEAFAAAWMRERGDLVFVPSRGGFASAQDLADKELLEAHRSRFDRLFGAVEALVTRANKLETKVGVLHKGYSLRHDKLTQGVAAAFKRVDQQTIEIGCYEMLEEMESRAIPSRLGDLRQQLEAAKAREMRLQARYAELQEEVRTLQAAA